MANTKSSRGIESYTTASPAIPSGGIQHFMEPLGPTDLAVVSVEKVLLPLTSIKGFQAYLTLWVHRRPASEWACRWQGWRRRRAPCPCPCCRACACACVCACASSSSSCAHGDGGDGARCVAMTEPP